MTRCPECGDRMVDGWTVGIHIIRCKCGYIKIEDEEQELLYEGDARILYMETRAEALSK